MPQLKLNSKDILWRAEALSEMAMRLANIAQDFDETGDECECCGAVRYRNWPQREVRKRIEGVAEKVKNLSDVLSRRHDDETFLHGGAR